jgi:hypothetical protein
MTMWFNACCGSEDAALLAWTAVVIIIALTLWGIWPTIWFIDHLSVATILFLVWLQLHVLLIDKFSWMRGRTLTAVAGSVHLYIGRELGQYSCLSEIPTKFDWAGLLVPTIGVLLLFVAFVVGDQFSFRKDDSGVPNVENSPVVAPRRRAAQSSFFQLVL